MAGTTIELLQRLIENPGKVARYKTSTEFSIFGGKSKTTQPFPMPHEVMNDFVTFFDAASKQIKLYPEEPLRAIDFSSWEYEPNQALLVFLAKYCKGANNDRLAKAVLTAAAQILQKYPGSLMHEFWLLHEIRHALNFDKNDKDPATDTKRKRQDLIDKEKEVFRQIKIIYTLLAKNSIQQALKQLKAFAVPIELTLPQTKYALLVLECYRLLPSGFNAITLANKNVDFLSGLSIIQDFGEEALERVDPANNLPNFSLITTSYLQSVNLRVSEKESDMHFSHPKNLDPVWVEFFKTCDLARDFMDQFRVLQPASLTQANLAAMGGAATAGTTVNRIQTADNASVSSIGTDNTASRGSSFSSVNSEVDHKGLRRAGYAPFASPIKEGLHEADSAPPSAEKAYKQDGDEDGMMLTEAAVRGLSSQFTSQQPFDTQSCVSDMTARTGNTACTTYSRFSTRSEYGRGQLERLAFSSDIKDDFNTAYSAYSDSLSENLPQNIENLRFVLRHMDYAFRFTSEFDLSADQLKARLRLSFAMMYQYISSLLSKIPNSSDVELGKKVPQYAVILTSAQATLDTIRPSSSEKCSLLAEGGKPKPFAPFSFAYYCEYVYNEKYLKGVPLEEYEFTFIQKYFRYLYEYECLLDMVITSGQLFYVYIQPIVEKMLPEPWMSVLQKLEQKITNSSSDKINLYHQVAVQSSYFPRATKDRRKIDPFNGVSNKIDSLYALFTSEEKRAAKASIKAGRVKR